MLEASVAAAPDRGGFRSAAAIENENSRIVKPGISEGADGVGEMVIHEAKLRFRWSEEAPEMIFAAALVGHAEELPRRIEQRAGVHRLPARGVAAQIVQVCSARTRPALADVIHFVGANAGEIQASANREGGEPRVVLHAAEAFFGDGEQHFSIARNARRGIVHLRIIDSDRDHIAKTPPVRGRFGAKLRAMRPDCAWAISASP